MNKHSEKGIIAVWVVALWLFSVTCLNAAGRHAGYPYGVTLSDIEAFMLADGEYQALLQRYIENDTSISPREYALLYYGYSFTEGFSTFSTERWLVELWESNPEPPEGRTLEIPYRVSEEEIKVYSEYLQHEPVSLYVLKRYSDLHNSCESPEPDPVWTTGLQALTEVVLHSGDGTRDYPYQILFTRDAFGIFQSDDPEHIWEYGVENRRIIMRYVAESPGWGGKTVRRTIKEAYFAFDLCNPGIMEELDEFFVDENGEPVNVIYNRASKRKWW
ncbi:MAG: DUF4919 domain-containing protein [Alistipes sp.]|nr:DUF4919 domain-containing protein [Alistipes sp.]